jgi:hypothetical protein
MDLSSVYSKTGNQFDKVTQQLDRREPKGVLDKKNQRDFHSNEPDKEAPA